MSRKQIFLDVECYPNYFLICFKHKSQIRYYELYEGNPLDIKAVSDIMSGYLTIGFNSLNYDLPMIAYAVEGVSNHQLKRLSDSLITSNKYRWEVLQDYNLVIPKKWDHVDLIEPAPAVADGLKMYGARMHTKVLQDLPLEPDSVIDVSIYSEIRKYCVNDVIITEELYEQIKGRIELREQICKQYDIDVRSKSDAQIAESVFKKLLNLGYRQPVINKDAIYKYTPPKFIKFKTDEGKNLLNTLVNLDFKCDDRGKVREDIFKGVSVTIKGVEITLGIGGLHSTEKAVTTIPNEDEFLIDVDVASYYPSIILNNGYYPNLIGEEWLNLYKFFYDERLKSKKNKEAVKAESYKIILNGSFGKFGSVYSHFYSPSMLLHTTITGQLSLVMLIETLLIEGFEVISANTDGITIKGKNKDSDKFNKIISSWEKVSKFNLDRVYYKAIYQECVNSYIAITHDNKVKGKGVYAKEGLTKNPIAQICSEAVIEYLLTGFDIGEYIINNQKNITKFLVTRTVKQGAIYKGELLGKVIRWYYSTNGDVITYKKLIKKKCKKTGEVTEVMTDNKVAMSDGAVPLMRLPDEPVKDIDVDKYIDRAYKMLNNLGVKVW